MFNCVQVSCYDGDVVLLICLFTKDAALGVGEVVDCGELELESSKGGPKTVPLAATISPLRETLVLLHKSK